MIIINITGYMMTTYFWQSYLAFLTFLAKIPCFYVTLGTLKIRQDIMAQRHKTLRLIVHHILFYASYNHTHSCLETKLCF